MASTASRLLGYRRELLAGGVDPTVVDALVRDAAHIEIANAGLCVAHPQTANAPQGDE